HTVVSKPATGPSALLDKVTVTKPDISSKASLELDGPDKARRGDILSYDFIFKNGSAYPLNGTQAIITLPDGVSFDSTNSGTAAVYGNEVVFSLGRVLPGANIQLKINAKLFDWPSNGKKLTTVATLRSSTALPLQDVAETKVVGSKSGNNQG